MQQAILKTLIYSHLFSFPLAKNELWQFLIWESSKKPLKKEFNKTLKLLLKNKTIGQKDKLFYLKNKERLVKQRKSLVKTNQKKTKIAKKFVKKIEFIPWIKAILITGALAVKNAKQSDDIDLLIITSQNRLWLARFLCILAAEILGIRRRPNQKRVKNKICLNLFLSEENLAIPYQNQNLFTAHEIVQARPIFNENRTYEKFLNANLWVKEYLPNSFNNQQSAPLRQGFEGQAINNQQYKSKTKKKISSIFHDPLFIFNLLELFAYKFQLKYMESRKTTEQVFSSSAFFHPNDRGKTILINYTRKIKDLGV